MDINLPAPTNDCQSRGGDHNCNTLNSTYSLTVSGVIPPLPSASLALYLAIQYLDNNGNKIGNPVVLEPDVHNFAHISNGTYQFTKTLIDIRDEVIAHVPPYPPASFSASYWLYSQFTSGGNTWTSLNSGADTWILQ